MWYKTLSDKNTHLIAWNVILTQFGECDSLPKSSVGATRKVSLNWSQETMTCHSFNCFSIVWGQGNATLLTSLPSSCYMTPSQTQFARLLSRVHMLKINRDYVPCAPSFIKSRRFSHTNSTTIRYFFFTRGTLGCLLGFRPLGWNPAGAIKQSQNMNKTNNSLQ